MAHQLADSLLPEESLAQGEFLVSDDGRFRLYLESDGNLVAYAYDHSHGIRRFWKTDIHVDAFGHSFPVPNPADILLKFNKFVGLGPPPLDVFWGVALVDSTNKIYWSMGEPAAIWGPHRFAVQSDGNIVLTLDRVDTVERKAIGTGTDGQFLQPGAVPPNQTIAELPPQATITIPSNANTVIVNVSSNPISVQENQKFTTVLPNDSSYVAHPGTINITIKKDNYTDVKGPDGTPPHHGADEVAPVPPSPPGQPNRLEIGDNDSLKLTTHGGKSLLLTHAAISKVAYR